MTVILSGQEIAGKIAAEFPEAVSESNSQAVIIKSEFLLKAADYLKNSPQLAFNQLNDITAVDYLDYFEIIYRLTSLEHNHTAVLKIRGHDREKPEIPSVIHIWQGADLMEREIFDLMGISFSGHPNMKRIFLWEGFAGHPLRKDFVYGP
jgi:NADH-quinone oxidoreductase subunit C